jgi:hypothetical protein
LRYVIVDPKRVVDGLALLLTQESMEAFDIGVNIAITDSNVDVGEREILTAMGHSLKLNRNKLCKAINRRIFYFNKQLKIFFM